MTCKAVLARAMRRSRRDSNWDLYCAK